MAEPARALEAPRQPDGTSAAFGRRAGPSARRSAAMVWVAAAVVALLLVSDVRTARETAAVDQARRAELLSIVGHRKDRLETLEERVDALRAEVQRAEATRASGVRRLRAALREQEVMAGLTPLSGPGVRLWFSDAERACPQSTESCRIQDRDLREAVNTLFALGAEGVAVNGERVVATTAVRSAGRSVLVNFRALTSPYVVEAVGEPDALASRVAGSPLAADFRVWAAEYHLGFGIEPLATVRLPAHERPLRLGRAGPA